MPCKCCVTGCNLNYANSTESPIRKIAMLKEWKGRIPKRY